MVALSQSYILQLQDHLTMSSHAITKYKPLVLNKRILGYMVQRRIVVYIPNCFFLLSLLRAVVLEQRLRRWRHLLK